MSKLTPEEYVAVGGYKCPNCSRDEISGENSLESEGTNACQKISCYACGATWVDHYQLVGYVEFEAPK